MFGGSLEWDVYYGSTDFESLSEFAKKSISKPICTAHVPENCMAEDLAVLKSFLSKSTEELEEIEQKARNRMIAVQDEFEVKERELLSQQQALLNEMKDVINDAAGEFDYKLVIQVLDSRMED